MQLNLVNENGRYSEDVPLGLNGLSVLDDGQQKVLGLLKDDIIHRERYMHSYP